MMRRIVESHKAVGNSSPRAVNLDGGNKVNNSAGRHPGLKRNVDRMARSHRGIAFFHSSVQDDPK